MPFVFSLSILKNESIVFCIIEGSFVFVLLIQGQYLGYMFSGIFSSRRWDGRKRYPALQECC